MRDNFTYGISIQMEGAQERTKKLFAELQKLSKNAKDAMHPDISDL